MLVHTFAQPPHCEIAGVLELNCTVPGPATNCVQTSALPGNAWVQESPCPYCRRLHRLICDEISQGKRLQLPNFPQILNPPARNSANLDRRQDLLRVGPKATFSPLTR